MNPSIQIDLVGSRTPTPEEETFSWVKDAQKCQVESDRESKVKNETSSENKEASVDVQSQVSSHQTKVTIKRETSEVRS